MDISKRFNLIVMTDGSGIITRDIHSTLKEQCDDPEKPWSLNWRKRYRIRVGDTVVNPWGMLETIKEILHHEETESTNYLVEENGNCYLPRELNGIYVRSLTPEEVNQLTSE